jgi:hypothetical protein
MVQDQANWVGERQGYLVPTKFEYVRFISVDYIQGLTNHCTVNGQPANVTLPSNIAPGNYIIRHEIIALHLADTMGGAEFYPSCSQLNISGTGTGTPNSNELVSLPGAYSDNDPGEQHAVYCIVSGA